VPCHAVETLPGVAILSIRYSNLANIWYRSEDFNWLRRSEDFNWLRRSEVFN
jgi:hypothetical protein